jgi:hypothetical protein
MFGVRITRLPYTPVSRQPRSSATRIMMLGGEVCASDGAARATVIPNRHVAAIEVGVIRPRGV